MKFHIGAVLSVAFFSFSAPLAFAQRGLPPIVVRSPEAQKPAAPRRNAMPRRSARTESVQRANAPAAANTMVMTEAQFSELRRRNPTAVYDGRCYVGQDPDRFIRSSLRRGDDSGYCNTSTGQSPRTVGPTRSDWAAAGTTNTRGMTEAQFAAFRARHPTAVFDGRCYLGQDPDPRMRMLLLVRPTRLADERGC